MSTMASQITGVSIVCLAVCSCADQWKHQSFASLAFVRVIHQWPVNSPHKGPVTRKMFPFDHVIMALSGVAMLCMPCRKKANELRLYVVTYQNELTDQCHSRAEHLIQCSEKVQRLVMKCMCFYHKAMDSVLYHCIISNVWMNMCCPWMTPALSVNFSGRAWETRDKIWAWAVSA